MTEAVKVKEIQQQESIQEQSSPDKGAEQTNIQELAIVVIAKGLNPTSFTPDFLVNSVIIPADWLLAQKPVVNQQIIKNPQQIRKTANQQDSTYTSESQIASTNDSSAS